MTKNVLPSSAGTRRRATWIDRLLLASVLLFLFLSVVLA